MKDAYTPEEIREMQKRIKALEEFQDELLRVLKEAKNICTFVEDTADKKRYAATLTKAEFLKSKIKSIIAKSEELLNSKP